MVGSLLLIVVLSVVVDLWLGVLIADVCDQDGQQKVYEKGLVMSEVIVALHLAIALLAVDGSLKIHCGLISNKMA